MAKKEIAFMSLVTDLIKISPALDFFKDTAIVSTREKSEIGYTDGTFEWKDQTYCIFSNGDQYFYTRKFLEEHGLYHVGKIDLSENRWDTKDIQNFREDQSSISLQELFATIRERFVFYMDFPEEYYYDFLTCFVIYTYFYPLFGTAPILQLWGDFKTGKTKICALLEGLAFNPVNSSNISVASVFRLVEGRGAVLILDESEDLETSGRTKEINNMLLAGTGKNGSVLRQEKDNENGPYVTYEFKVFSPKVIANINGVTVPALVSRLIRFVTEGSTSKEKLNRTVELLDDCWMDIRNQLYRCCLTRFKEVKESKANLPETLFTGRSFGIWEGVLTIANCINKSVFESVLGYANNSVDDIKNELEENAPGNALLTTLAEIFTQKEEKFFASAYLKDKLHAHNQELPLWTGKQDFGQDMRRIGFKSEMGDIGNSKYARGFKLSSNLIERKLNRKHS